MGPDYERNRSHVERGLNSAQALGWLGGQNRPVPVFGASKAIG